MTLFPANGNLAIHTVSLTVHGVTSLQIRNGLLQPGATCSMTITANSAPWDELDRAPFRTGVPSASADSVSAGFAP